MSRSKYKAPNAVPQQKDLGSEKISLRGIDKLNLPLVRADGTLYVQSLESASSDGLTYKSDAKETTVLFSKDLDSNTKVEFIPKYVDKVYNTTISYTDEIKSCFGVYRNEVKRFIVEELQRYKTSPKGLRKEIDTVTKNKNQFFFTEKKGSAYWSQMYIDTTHFGPYNYDCKLQVTKDIEMLNDLLVVRTGSFENTYHRSTKKEHKSPYASNIAWMSHHDTITYTGNAIYTNTGTYYTSKLINATGDLAPTHSGSAMFDKHHGLTNQENVHALSSKFYNIPKDQYLYSGISYYDTVNDTTVTEPNPLYDDFWYTYEKYKTKYNTGGWDGIIPSGIPFSIETWSTNPRHIGFNGEITIQPTGASDPTCTYSATVTGSAQDLDYQQSVRKAVNQAKKKFYKNLNKVLIQKGIKYKSARMTKYENLLERVAQNVYDGLSIVRNEQIARDQGLTTNPLNSSNYYDGTSKMYGGSHMNALYDHSKTTSHKLTTSASTSSSSSSSSSSGSSSSGGGY
tara:strand:- start:138 stop:1670 length:1533 start_codon:yes stop_codon:yes gene_type:complete